MAEKKEAPASVWAERRGKPEASEASDCVKNAATRRTKKSNASSLKLAWQQAAEEARADAKEEEGDLGPELVNNSAFLEMVFHAMAEGAAAWVCAFAGDPATSGKWGGFPVTDVMDLPRNAERGDLNSFFAISSFRVGDDEEYHRRKTLHVATHCVVMDDIGLGESAKIDPAKVNLEPSWVLETSPGNCQMGYILDRPITDRWQAETLISALVHQGLLSAEDPGMKNVTRYMRLPVGSNRKAKYGSPFPHRLREWNPECRYSLQEIVEAYGLDLAAEAPAPSEANALAAEDADADPYLKVLDDLRLLKADGRMEKEGQVWFDMICPWVGSHTDGDDTGTAYMAGGGFKCFHGHCQDRRFPDLKSWLKGKGLDVGALDGKQNRLTGYSQNPIGAIRGDRSVEPDKSGGWLAQLLTNQQGNYIRSYANCTLIFALAPGWQGVLGLDEFAGLPTLLKPLPFWEGAERMGNSFKPRALTDGDVRAVAQHFELAYFNSIAYEHVQRAVSWACDQLTFHPLRDYLDGLRWDGTPRVNNFFGRYFGTNNADGTAATDRYLEEVGRCGLLQAVARVYQPGCQADYVVVLEGPQGILKSTALRVLAGDRYFDDNLPHDLGSKDAKDHLRGKWLIELGELAQMRKSEAEAVKSFVTRREERYRPAYGRQEIVYPRQCVFWGTTNAEEYLQDRTGNRRFWPVRVSKVDIKALARDRDQLWAEAVHRHKDGEEHYITDPKVLATANEEQAERISTDPWEDALGGFLMNRQEVFLKDIWEHLEIEAGRQQAAMGHRLAGVLNTLGWKKAGRSGSMGRNGGSDDRSAGCAGYAGFSLAPSRNLSYGYKLLITLAGSVSGHS